MPKGDTQISISSNNSELESIFVGNELHSEIDFVKKEKENLLYRVFLIDTQSDLTHISQSLIKTYNICRENNSKLVVVILHGDSIDTEKNHYFQKMLDDLGKNIPIHRLVFTKDLYQTTSPIPATPLDKEIYESIQSKIINITQKGKKLYFPLVLEDFVKALAKTLFLSNTSGKSFWILGDATTDLELAYLLKKYIYGTGETEAEINAQRVDDLKTNSLLSIGNKSRSELNWNPENEIVDDLKKIVSMYVDTPQKAETKTVKLNPLHRLLTWIYKPRPKKENRLPTFKKIAILLLKVAILITLILGSTFVISTGMSLKQLERSVNQALNGDLQGSVSSLKNAVSLKETGESSIAPLVPLMNLVSPRYTEKIFNLYSFIDYASTSLNNLHQTYVMAESLLLSLNKDETKPNYSDLSLALHSNLSQVYENLNHISILSSTNKLPEFLEKKLESNSEFQNLKTLEEQVAQYIKIIDIIPSVLPRDKAVNIIIYLQNSQALRHSGGEIDYYLLLTLDQGNLISKKYFTESELDALYSDANPVTQISRRFAFAPTPKLNDINKNPDFFKSSVEISNYLEKGLKIKPDFIIATNDLLIKQLLLEEKSTVADQFNKNYLEASGAAVYKEVFDQYLERLFNQDISLPVLGKTIAKTIGDNQILIWSADTNTQKILSTQSYSGVISPRPCNAGITTSAQCTSQISFISEHSILPARQSPWSDRNINHTISISSTQIQHEYQINYTSNLHYSPNTPVLNTYSLFTSSPSSLNQVLLNDLPSSIKDVVKITEGTLDIYTIPLSLSPDKNALVNIKITSTAASASFSPLSYSVTEYRQPGTTDPGITLKVTYPENFRPLVVTSPFTAEPSTMKITLPPHTFTFGFTLDQNKQ